MPKILGRTTSINVRKVLWLCAELGLTVEQEQWGIGFRSTDDAGFRALNPNALVPVLIDGDFVLWESNTICRYLAAAHGREDLHPAAPSARAMVDQWLDWQMGELNRAWSYAFMALVRCSPAHRDPAAVAASVAAWNRQMTILEAQLRRTGAYAAGPTFTLADIALGLSTHRWRTTPMARMALPAVAAYLERLGERPGFRLYATSDLP